MSKICQITGKRAMVGNNVSHSKRRTKRTFDVNLFHKKFYYVEEDCWISLRISASGLRYINKVGLDAALKNAVAQGFCDWKTIRVIGLFQEELIHGKEGYRQSRPGYPGVHRDEGEWSARNITLRDNQEPQEHSRAHGAQEVQPHS